MYTEVIEKYDVFAVAEGAGSTFKDAHDLVDADRKELQMAYHFESVDMSRTPDGYTLDQFKDVFTKWDSSFADKGWIAIFLSNHDNARLVNRFGNPSPEFRTPSAQMLNTFLLSMRGTPYTYYGDELGMTNIDMPTIEEYVDIDAIGKYKAALKSGMDMNEFMKILNYSSRENGRTPMQWDETPNAGFTTGKPWARVNENYKEINVLSQNNDPNSILNHFKKMTKVRKDNPVLVYGKYNIIQKEHPEIYAFTRTLDNEKVLVLLNFSTKSNDITLANIGNLGSSLINNYPAVQINGDKVSMLPYQAVILKIEK